MELVLVKIHARAAHAVEVQEVLTKHGCSITLRLGLHEVSADQCANDGLIILKVIPDPAVINLLTKELSVLEGVEVKAVSF